MIVLVGPTAVGKSEVALRLAGILKTEILSADSRQVYRGLDIGTSKPSAPERALVRHHLIDIADPGEPFSAGRYAREAGVVIEEMRTRGLTPLVVGGTGLYVKALLSGLWPGPPADWGLRRRLEVAERREGPGTLHRRLRHVDPESAVAIHPHDLPKIIRALEVFERTGRPLSEAHRLSGGGTPPRPAVVIGLTRDRADLYSRIEQRVDRMVRTGLIAEVRRLLASGCDEGSGAMRALGYRQIVEALRGRCTADEAIRRLKRDTKRYAKRQWTWFRRDSAIQWIELAPGEEPARTVTRMRDMLSERGVL